MRLFIAIPVPQNLHRYCRQLQSQFEGLKKTEEFHITLQFLGDDTEEPDKIIAALSQIELAPFEIEMGDAVPFGPKHEPRGAWIKCKENKFLQSLAENIRKKLTPLGYTSDKPFRAHITLGRYKSSPGHIPKTVEGMPHRFKVNHFELIQSHLGDKGPAYKTLAIFSIQTG
ncbi:RNA 2',3'-cyclic phosphodiesterase [Candidatus Peregrinibacteria bacterium]|nr:RNA 2',3'-cyclic phosphodiesterase [Candidatus Peregrinibacteria bacterium]